jgi:hypothetical protein
MLIEKPVCNQQSEISNQQSALPLRVSTRPSSPQAVPLWFNSLLLPRMISGAEVSFYFRHPAL